MASGKWQVALGRWKMGSSTGDALGQAMTNKQRNEVEMAKRERKRRSEGSEEDKQTLANEDM